MIKKRNNSAPITATKHIENKLDPKGETGATLGTKGAYYSALIMTHDTP
jgi:hypothetical protein